MRTVFCQRCGACLGEYRPYFAKEHAKQYPSHNEFLVKNLIDPLRLPEAEFKKHLEVIPNSMMPITPEPVTRDATPVQHHPKMQQNLDYIACPECNCISIRVTDGKIARHESGLGYVPYRLYRALRKRHPDDPTMSIREQMKRNLCHASGRRIES